MTTYWLVPLVLVIASCSFGGQSLPSFDDVAEDAVFAMRLEHASPGELSGRSGRDGPFGPTDTVVRRVWTGSQGHLDLLVHAVDRASEVEAASSSLFCAADSFSVRGTKEIASGEFAELVMVTARHGDPPAQLHVSLTVGVGASNARYGPPPRLDVPRVVGDCPPSVVDRVDPYLHG